MIKMAQLWSVALSPKTHQGNPRSDPVSITCKEGLTWHHLTKLIIKNTSARFLNHLLKKTLKTTQTLKAKTTAT